MGLLKKALDPRYRAVCGVLEEKGFDLEDVTLGKNNFSRAILNDKVILESPYRIEEMTYESFLDEAKKYNDLCHMLNTRGYFKKRSLLGVDVYQKENKKWLLGRDVLFIFGKNKEKFTYDEAKSVLESWW